MAVGQGKVLENGKLVPLEVTTGDQILFSKYSGSDIKLDGEEHLIVGRATFSAWSKGEKRV